MYGFIHCALADWVTGEYGEHIWQDIINQSGIELGGGSFLVHKIYEEDTFYKLLDTTAQVQGIEREDCLARFGEHFYDYCIRSGYERVLRVLGGTLEALLSNLDALHDHLGATYPGMSAPSFRCISRQDGTLQLNYSSSRPGMFPMVSGLVKKIARELFHSRVEIQILSESNCNNTGEQQTVCSIEQDQEKPSEQFLQPRRDNFVIQKPRNIVYRNRRVRKMSLKCCSQEPKDLALGVESFCRAFPFHVMFDKHLEIRQAGVAMLRVIKTYRRRHKNLNFLDIFSVVRPVLDVTFQELLDHTNTVFVVTTKPGVLDTYHRRCDSLKRNITNKKEAENENEVTMRLKGQMIYIPESDNMLYLCSPRVQNLDDLKGRGLFLSDIPLHDATRDLILISQARRAERELVEKLEDTSNNLKMLQTRLQEDKQRTDELLHSILPPSIAERLRLNQPVEAEKYSLVTVLFSDVVGFTALCGNEKVVPMDIVRLLNKLYTQFDVLCSVNEVRKMETIGDAYMVVGGLPDYIETHADRVCSMSCGMIEVSRNVMMPADQKPIQIRIGVHSGPVVAGVVGQKMPRYCLFGDTVTIANKMESVSQPGKVTISQQAKDYIISPLDFIFEENLSRPDMPCRCFFVTTQPNSPRHLSPMEFNLSLPLGLFRTPNPSPTNSPGCLSPASPTAEDSPLSPARMNSPQAMSPSFKMPTIKISDTDSETTDRIASLDAKMVHYTKMEQRLRQKLNLSAPDVFQKRHKEKKMRRKSLDNGHKSPEGRPRQSRSLSFCQFFNIPTDDVPSPEETQAYTYEMNMARLLGEKLQAYAAQTEKRVFDGDSEEVRYIADEYTDESCSPSVSTRSSNASSRKSSLEEYDSDSSDRDTGRRRHRRHRMEPRATSPAGREDCDSLSPFRQRSRSNTLETISETINANHSADTNNANSDKQESKDESTGQGQNNVCSGEVKDVSSEVKVTDQGAVSKSCDSNKTGTLDMEQSDRRSSYTGEPTPYQVEFTRTERRSSYTGESSINLNLKHMTEEARRFSLGASSDLLKPPSMVLGPLSKTFKMPCPESDRHSGGENVDTEVDKAGKDLRKAKDMDQCGLALPSKSTKVSAKPGPDSLGAKGDVTRPDRLKVECIGQKSEMNAQNESKDELGATSVRRKNAVAAKEGTLDEQLLTAGSLVRESQAVRPKEAWAANSSVNPKGSMHCVAGSSAGARPKALNDTKGEVNHDSVEVIKTKKGDLSAKISGIPVCPFRGEALKLTLPIRDIGDSRIQERKATKPRTLDTGGVGRHGVDGARRHSAESEAKGKTQPETKNACLGKHYTKNPAGTSSRRVLKGRERRNSTGIPNMDAPKVIPITKAHSAREYTHEDYIDFNKTLQLKETIVKNLAPPSFIVCSRSKSDSQINCIFAAFQDTSPEAGCSKPRHLLSPEFPRYEDYHPDSRSPTSPGTPRRRSRLGRPKVKLESLMDAQINEFAQHVKGRRKYRSTSSENRRTHNILGRYHRLGCSVCSAEPLSDRHGLNGRLSPRARTRGNTSPGSEDTEGAEGQSSRKSSSDENGNKSRKTVPNRNTNSKSPGPSRKASKIPCPTQKAHGDKGKD